MNNSLPPPRDELTYHIIQRCMNIINLHQNLIIENEDTWYYNKQQQTSAVEDNNPYIRPTTIRPAPSQPPPSNTGPKPHVLFMNILVNELEQTLRRIFLTKIHSRIDPTKTTYSASKLSQICRKGLEDPFVSRLECGDYKIATYNNSYGVPAFVSIRRKQSVDAMWMYIYVNEQVGSLYFLIYSNFDFKTRATKTIEPRYYLFGFKDAVHKEPIGLEFKSSQETPYQNNKGTVIDNDSNSVGRMPQLGVTRVPAGWLCNTGRKQIYLKDDLTYCPVVGMYIE